MLVSVGASVATSLAEVFVEMTGCSSSDQQSGSTTMVGGVAPEMSSWDKAKNFSSSAVLLEKEKGIFSTPQRNWRWWGRPSTTMRRAVHYWIEREVNMVRRWLAGGMPSSSRRSKMVGYASSASTPF